jgi:hypothetical protein
MAGAAQCTMQFDAQFAKHFEIIDKGIASNNQELIHHHVLPLPEDHWG